MTLESSAVPNTEEPATTTPESTGPAAIDPAGAESSATSPPESSVPTVSESPTSTSIQPAVEAVDTLAATPQLDDPTYGVSVAAVCVDLTPFVDIESTGTGDIRVAVGPESMVLTADQPKGQLAWPTVDGSTPDTVAKWDAVRLDTMEPIDNGLLTLPADCPPPPIVPSAPEGLAATPGNTTVTLQWSPPTSDGGLPIVDYIVERSPDGITAWTVVDDGDGTATTATIAGLTNGTLYYFRIVAVNANGPGPASLDVKVTPRTVPSAPQSFAAAPTNLSGQIRLTWAAPSSDGGSAITDYIIQRSLTGTSDWTLVPDGTSTEPHSR